MHLKVTVCLEFILQLALLNSHLYLQIFSASYSSFSHVLSLSSSVHPRIQFILLLMVNCHLYLTVHLQDLQKKNSHQIPLYHWHLYHLLLLLLLILHPVLVLYQELTPI